jgi:hypothetical protein
LLGADTKKKLDLKENPETGVYVQGLSSFVVKNIPEMENYMEIGNNARSVAATQMNARSSRSHSIFTIVIERSEPDPQGGDKPKVEATPQHKQYSFYLAATHGKVELGRFSRIREAGEDGSRGPNIERSGEN